MADLPEFGKKSSKNWAKIGQNRAKSCKIVFDVVYLNMSKTWLFFKKNEDGTAAICNECGKQIKTMLKENISDTL